MVRRNEKADRGVRSAFVLVWVVGGARFSKRVRDGERAAGRAVVLLGDPVDRVVGIVGSRAGWICERERVANVVVRVLRRAERRCFACYAELTSLCTEGVT